MFVNINGYTYVFQNGIFYIWVVSIDKLRQTIYNIHVVLSIAKEEFHEYSS